MVNDNKLKKISRRKAYKERQNVDALAYSLFSTTLKVIFRRIQEIPAAEVEKTFDALLARRREEALTILTITADKGCGKLKLVQKLIVRVVGFIFVMPELYSSFILFLTIIFHAKRT